MNSILLSCTKKILVIIFIFFSFSALGQTLPPPKIVSPNSTSIDRFVETPVNMFNGSPNISIPIHTLKCGNIAVPISLQYNAGGVRPSTHPGWVGLGWNLESYGVITRQKRGFIDDLYGDPGSAFTAPDGNFNSYYPVAGNSANFAKSGSDFANDPDWYTAAHLTSDYTGSNTPGVGVNDVEADEFTFNFMGYSGKFYYCGGANPGWRAVCDEHITVTLNPTFLKPADICSAIDQFIPFQQPTCGNCEGPPNQYLAKYQPNQFSGFTITTPDGTQYIFGGVNAIEFNSNFQWQTGPNPDPYRFAADAWLLSKIIDVNHNEVDFNYQRTYPTCNLAFSYNAYSISTSQTQGLNCTASGSQSGAVMINDVNGSYEWPMYLKTITTPNETVSFAISPATCLRYPDAVMQFTNQFYSQGQIPANPSPTNGNVNNLQWEQLNSISITNTTSASFRKYMFNYSNSATQVLTLTNFAELDNTQHPVENYYFNYNNVQNLSMYNGGSIGGLNYYGDGVDHWGYYNGRSVSGLSGSDIFTAKQTDATVVTTGLLNQVTYPTGGNTKLTWEAHDYSQVVATSRQAPLVSATGYAGGSRIREIKSVDVNNNVLLDKTYFYKRGYLAGNNGPQGSSGVLNGTPQYTFSAANRSNGDGTVINSMNFTSLQSRATYGYNGSGSYIGYDEVAEVNADGSYTRNFFTNYGPDLNNVSHFDQPAAGSIGWIAGGSEDAYFPMSTLERERGKPVGVYHYTANNIPVEQTVYTYRNDAARFNNYINLITFSNIIGCNNGGAVIFASAAKQFAYNYYTTSKKVISFDQQGLHPTTATESYAYNANNLLSTKTAVNSRGETVTSNYTYPTDYSDGVSNSMTAANFINPVIQTTVTNTVGPVSLSKTTYASFSGNYRPQIVRLQSGSNPIETRQQFYNYDAIGNVQEISQTGNAHDVYLYGYNSQYPVAKISNSTITAVQQVMAQNNITQAQLDNAAASTDAQMRTLLNTLRTTLPASLVNTYTYAPAIGITSETDPKGNIAFYEYDAAQRLMNVKDLNGNIIKHYDYHYSSGQ